VYAAEGRSCQQRWIWSAEAGTLTQISHAERDHPLPDSTRILIADAHTIHLIARVPFV